MTFDFRLGQARICNELPTLILVTEYTLNLLAAEVAVVENKKLVMSNKLLKSICFIIVSIVTKPDAREFCEIEQSPIIVKIKKINGVVIMCIVEGYSL